MADMNRPLAYNCYSYMEGGRLVCCVLVAIGDEQTGFERVIFCCRNCDLAEIRTKS
jgi:hypothetical protein